MPKQNLSWFKMRAENGVATINILGDIGGFGVTYDSFQRSLDSLGPVSEINLRIQSDGGEVHQGFAIYNALQLHPAKKTVTVMGLAASMASVVAMAGDVRRMPKNAVMMIHNPIGGVQGNGDEIVSYGEAVNDMGSKIAQTYADASGGKLSVAKAQSLMDKQSWLGADQCLALGLCTDIIEPLKMAAHFKLDAVSAPDWKCGADGGLAIDDTSSWDGGAASNSLLDAAGIGGKNPDVAKARRGFLAYDAASPNLRGSYKLPFAILSGGTLKASTAGIRAAASRLPQTDIPQSVKDTARGVLDKYEAKSKPKGHAMTKNANAEGAEMFEGEDQTTVTEARADERKRVLAQQKEVNSICRVAGHPELAAKFNEDGKSLTEVVAELDKLGKGKTTTRASADTGKTEAEISARRAIDTGDEQPALLDFGNIYADYNNPGTITKRNQAARASRH